MDNQQNNLQAAGPQQTNAQPTAVQPQQQYAQPQQQFAQPQQQYAQPQQQYTQPQQQYAQPQQQYADPQQIVVPPQQFVQQQPVRRFETIYCSTCGQQIAKVARACPFCGAPVYQNLPREVPQQIIINNSNNANTVQAGYGYGPVPAGLRAKDKWIALLLWFFLGFVGAHKFYEGKILMGIVYILTVGLFGIGWVVDFFVLLFKPNPYYV